MKKTRKGLLILLALIIASSAFSAETSVKGTIFSNWMMNLTEGKNNYNAFTIDRAYLGAESKLSDFTWMRITFDVRPEKFKTSETNITDTGGDTVKLPKLTAYSGYAIILKYAYADWKVKPVENTLKLRFGMQPTMYLNYMDANWNRRYIDKNAGDLNEFTTSSDLGISALVSLGPQGSLGESGLSLLNGTKYSDFEDKNNNKDLNFFGKLTPFYNNGDFNQVGVFGQVYLGTQNRAIASTETATDWKNQIVSVGGKLAYQKKIDFCFDMNFRTLGQGVGKDDLKQNALSFWGNIYMNALAPTSTMFKSLVLYGRFDQYDPNTNVNDDGYSLLIAGVECAPIKGVKASIAYKQKTLQVANGVDEKYLMLNTEFKF